MSVFTIPRLLRPLFRRRRELLIELAHAAATAIHALMQEALGGGLRPGVVACVATAGDLVQWHPHLHVLASSGAFAAGGRFHPLDPWDGPRLMSLFREHGQQAVLYRSKMNLGLGRNFKALHPLEWLARLRPRSHPLPPAPTPWTRDHSPGPA